MAKYDLKTFARAWTCQTVNGPNDEGEFDAIFVEGRDEPFELNSSLPIAVAPDAGDRVVELAGSYVWMTPAEFDAAFEPAV